MDPPDHMKLEPTTCSLSGVIPEVNDPPMIAAVEGTAWVQSGSVSHSCLRQCSMSQRHIRKSFMQTENLSNTLIPLVHHLSLSYYIQQTSQRYLIALCEHFYITVWSPSPDNQQNQNNYYTVAQQDEEYKGTPLRTSSQTVCYMLSVGQVQYKTFMCFIHTLHILINLFVERSKFMRQNLHITSHNQTTTEGQLN